MTKELAPVNEVAFGKLLEILKITTAKKIYETENLLGILPIAGHPPKEVHIASWEEYINFFDSSCEGANTESQQRSALEQISALLFNQLEKEPENKEIVIERLVKLLIYTSDYDTSLRNKIANLAETHYLEKVLVSEKHQYEDLTYKILAYYPQDNWDFSRKSTNALNTLFARWSKTTSEDFLNCPMTVLGIVGVINESAWTVVDEDHVPKESWEYIDPKNIRSHMDSLLEKTCQNEIATATTLEEIVALHNRTYYRVSKSTEEKTKNKINRIAIDRINSAVTSNEIKEIKSLLGYVGEPLYLPLVSKLYKLLCSENATE
jgi:hypothetical protein